VNAPAVAHRSLLSFDYGDPPCRRGHGNSAARPRAPLRTLAAEGDARFAAIAALLAEWQPDALVVGVPFHPDGAEHDNTLPRAALRRQLRGRFGLPVHEVDERYTTTEAAAGGAADADAARRR
jgi:putative holliday junction resolvase